MHEFEIEPTIKGEKVILLAQTRAAYV